MVEVAARGAAVRGALVGAWGRVGPACFLEATATVGCVTIEPWAVACGWELERCAGRRFFPSPPLDGLDSFFFPLRIYIYKCLRLTAQGLCFAPLTAPRAVLCQVA